MQRSGTHSAAFLSLGKLETDPRIARRIPLHLARRFHALPVAEQDGCVTVAMADPDDQAARAAIQTALGLASFMVRMDCAAVDALIDAAWNAGDRQIPRLLVCTTPSARPDEFTHYAHQMADLLKTVPHWLEEAALDSTPEAGPIPAQYNLLLFDSVDHPALHRLLVDASSRGKREREPVPGAGRGSRAAVIAPQPRWPLQRILLIISGEEEDDAAVEWMLRLARAGHCTVTALAVVPPVPAMYGQRPALAQGLPALLSTNSTMGWRMRNTARLLVEWEIEGTLRLRQGPPDWQIRRELAEKEYDLVVLGTRPRRQWLRWLEGDTLCTLLHCSRQPVLIAMPARP
jgi:nucleotide-binding universal stress UspA family protein